MRSYGSKSFTTPRRTSKTWKWLGIGLCLGFAGGFVLATAVSVKKSVELVVSMPERQDVFTDNVSTQDGPEVWSDSKNISVRIPLPNALVKSPLTVEGLERTFEQNVVMRLKDGKDQEMVKMSVTGSAPDAGILGPYHGEVTFEKPATKTGTLEVFQASAKDGSEIDKVTIPVRFE